MLCNTQYSASSIMAQCVCVYVWVSVQRYIGSCCCCPCDYEKLPEYVAIAGHEYPISWPFLSVYGIPWAIDMCTHSLLPPSLPPSLQGLKKHDAKVVVRCCDPSYSTESLTKEGIRVVVRQTSLSFDTSSIIIYTLFLILHYRTVSLKMVLPLLQRSLKSGST